MKDLKELNILLAEDDRINQRIAILTFNRMGISIDIASNGQEALEMYLQKRYDLILMDMNMPVMGGLEATRQIRTFEKETDTGHHAYIVALTASVISDMKEVCIQAGMDDFMEKPFRESTLRVLLAK